MARLRKLLAVGLGAVGAGVGVWYCTSDNRVLQAAQVLHELPLRTTTWDWNWDRREPAFMIRPSDSGEDDKRFTKELEEVRPKATRHLLLIRHGQYNMSGKTEIQRVLTDKGIQQAKATGDRIVALNLPYQLMVRSTMTRAQQTGDYILTRMQPGSVAIKDDKILEEGSPYPAEPSNGSWKPEVNFFQGGSRIEAAFRNYFYRADYRQQEDTYDIIVCHANVIRYFVCRALQLPPEAWLRITLNHGSITWLSIRPNGLVGLQCLGDSGHLPQELLTH